MGRKLKYSIEVKIKACKDYDPKGDVYTMSDFMDYKEKVYRRRF